MSNGDDANADAAETNDTTRDMWYFTFGDNHIPGLWNYVIMEDMTWSEARRFMFEMAGPKFSFQYSSEQAHEYINPRSTCIRRLTRAHLPGHLAES